MEPRVAAKAARFNVGTAAHGETIIYHLRLRTCAHADHGGLTRTLSLSSQVRSDPDAFRYRACEADRAADQNVRPGDVLERLGSFRQ